MLLEVLANVLQVRSGGRRPTNAHLGAQHPLETGVHFFFFDEFAAVGLRDTFTHGGTEVGFFLKEAQRRVLYQVFRVGPCLGSDLR